MKKKNHIVFLVICSVIVAQVCLAQDLSIGKEEISPDNLPGDEIPDWVARWELARVLSYIKRYDESLIEYQKVLSEKPESFKARAEMAAIIYYSGDKGKALLEFEKLNTEKLSSDSRIVLADIYMTMKQYDKAESIYREHLSKQPNDYKVHRKLAKILSWDKRYKESLPSMKSL